MPRYEPINLGFSTADGESPVIHYDGGELGFRFTDWRESVVEFVASGVLHFAWSDELFDPAIRDDFYLRGFRLAPRCSVSRVQHRLTRCDS